MTVPNLWRNNLAVLKQHYPALHALVAAHETGGTVPLPASFEIVKTTTGSISLKAAGVMVHSSRDPLREAARLVESTLSGRPPDGAIVVLGFGLGYAAAAAARAAPQSPLIIVEKESALFAAALFYRDLRALFEEGKHIFVIGGDAEGILAGLSVVKTVRAVLRNPALARLNEPWYAEVERHLELWQTKEEVNAATLRRFGRCWARNILGNLESIRDLPGIAFLAGTLDFPAVLLAAGPSLDDIRPYLAALRERCLLIAVDTAQRFLNSCALNADFVVSADPQYWNLRHLDRAAFTQETCLIACPSVQNAVLRAAPRIVLASSSFPLERFIERAVGQKGKLDAGGSVATSAFDAATFIRGKSANPLFIAGLDLAFPQGKTHFAGAYFEERSLAAQSRFVPAEGLNFLALHNAAPYLVPSLSGGMVLTDKRLSLYARWFEHRFVSVREPVFSLSAKGMAIPGLSVAGIEKALDLPPCRAAIDRAKNAVFTQLYAEWKKTDEPRKEHFRKAKHELIDALEAVRAAPAALKESPVCEIVRFIAPYREGESEAELLSRYAQAAAWHLRYLGS